MSQPGQKPAASPRPRRAAAARHTQEVSGAPERAAELGDGGIPDVQGRASFLGSCRACPPRRPPLPRRGRGLRALAGRGGTRWISVEEEYRSLCAPRPPSPRVRGSLPRTAGLPCGSGAVGRGCLQNTSSLTSWRPNPGAGPGGWGRGLRPLPRCRPPGSCGSPELSALRSQPDSLWSPRPLAPLPASSPGPSPRGSEQVGVAMAFASWWYKTHVSEKNSGSSSKPGEKKGSDEKKAASLGSSQPSRAHADGTAPATKVSASSGATGKSSSMNTTGTKAIPISKKMEGPHSSSQENTQNSYSGAFPLGVAPHSDSWLSRLKALLPPHGAPSGHEKKIPRRKAKGAHR
uniref:Uncharacterized protein LOC109684721 n=1 Tax=Castor canadensis TaxID=51338 RepID=A0A8B7UC60_CASCN